MKTQRLLRARRLQFFGTLPLALSVMLAGYLEAQDPMASLSQPTEGTGRFNRQEQIERRQKRLEEFLNEHKDEKGRVRQDLWLQGIYDFKRMKVGTSITLTPSTKGEAPAVVGVQWTQVGPQPLRIDMEQNFQGAGPDSGQVTDIAIDPRNTSDQVIYIASNDGGIWKSSDGGSLWTPKTDFMPSSYAFGRLGGRPSTDRPEATGAPAGRRTNRATCG